MIRRILYLFDHHTEFAVIAAAVLLVLVDVLARVLIAGLQ